MVYFFHLTEGDHSTRDPEGSDLPNMTAVEKVAVEGVRSLMAEAVTKGERDYRGSLDVEDQNGATVMSVRFACPIEIDAVMLPSES
jgi:hypothetical protein